MRPGVTNRSLASTMTTSSAAFRFVAISRIRPPSTHRSPVMIPRPGFSRRARRMRSDDMAGFGASSRDEFQGRIDRQSVVYHAHERLRNRGGFRVLDDVATVNN